MNSNNNSNEKNRVLLLEEALMKLEKIVGTKADIDSMKKLFSFYESKLNYLFQLVSSKLPIDEEDATIAKKNWHCLSCDKKLESYQGKIGHHLVSSQPKGKAIDNDMIGGGMMRSKSSRLDLPNVAKQKKMEKAFEKKKITGNIHVTNNE